MNLVTYGKTDAGTVRTRNEDALLVDPVLRLYAVADGMGGQVGGDVASELALKELQAYLTAQAPNGPSGDTIKARRDDAKRTLHRAILHANKAVYLRARNDQSLKDMGTTLTCVWVVDDVGIAVGHVGDTRLYLCRAEQVFQLTKDHTVAQALLDEGLVSEDEAAAHANRLVQAVGNDKSVTPDVFSMELCLGDTLLICSDGLGQYVGAPQELYNYMTKDDVRKIPAFLVGFANHSGGSDNITAVAIRASLADETRAEEVSRRSTMVRMSMSTLLQVRLFGEIPYADLVRVFEFADQVTLQQNQSLTLSSQGEGLTCAILTHGQLIGPDTTLYNPGAYFGCLGLLGLPEAPLELVAAETSRLVAFKRSTLVPLFEAEPEIRASMLEKLLQAVLPHVPTPFVGC